MNDLNINKIIEKITKLQALANDSAASESEVEQATLHIQKLLDKYNLTLEQVKPVTKTDVEFTPLKNDKAKLFDWEVGLSQTIANNFYCRVLFQKTSFLFIGASKDVAIVTELFTRIRVILDAMASRRVAEYSNRMYLDYGVEDARQLKGDQSLRTYRASYLNGAVNGLADKLRLQRQTVDQQTTALVVKRDELVKQAINDRFPKLTYIKRGQTNHNSEASKIGYSDGKTVNINRELPE